MGMVAGVGVTRPSPHVFPDKLRTVYYKPWQIRLVFVFPAQQMNFSSELSEEHL